MGTLKSCGTGWASHRGLGSKNGQQWMFLSFVFLCEPQGESAEKDGVV